MPPTAILKEPFLTHPLHCKAYSYGLASEIIQIWGEFALITV